MTTAEKLIKSKMNLLDLAAYLNNVSEACRVMGYSKREEPQKAEHQESSE